MSSTLRRLAAFVLVALVAAACGGGGQPTAQAPSSTPSAAPSAASPAASPAATPSATAAPAEEETTEPAQEEATAEEDEEETTEPVEEETTEEEIVLEGREEATAEVGDTMEAEEFDDVFSGEGEVAEEMAIPTEEAADPATAEYSEYVVITDDSGSIQLAVPSEWSEIDGRPYQDAQGRTLFDVRASSNLEQFQSAWDTPGVIVTASQEVAQSQNEVTLLDELVPGLSGQCTYDGRQPYSDAVYTGQFDVYSNCGGVGASYVVVGAVPSSRAFVIRVQVQVNAQRDLQALDAVLQSFEIVGDV